MLRANQNLFRLIRLIILCLCEMHSKRELFFLHLGGLDCCSSVWRDLSFGSGTIFWMSGFWNSAKRKLFMKPGWHPLEIFECTQVWNCGTLAQFETTMANAAEDLTWLFCRRPSPKNSRLVTYIAKPAGSVQWVGSLKTGMWPQDFTRYFVSQKYQSKR